MREDDEDHRDHVTASGARAAGYPEAHARAELRVRRGLRRRVPRLPVRLQRTRLRGARHVCGRPARADRLERPGRRGDGRSRGARGRRPDRRRRAACSAAISCGTGSGSGCSRASRSSTGCASSSSAARGSTTASRRACSRSPGTRRAPTSAIAEPRGGRALLELAPVPSWHELQFRR